jgi:hypothetical protein
MGGAGSAPIHRAAAPTTTRRGRGAAASKKKQQVGTSESDRRSKREEQGCLVVATSNASIKFHEVWSSKPRGKGSTDLAVAGGLGVGGLLGGSQILEGECSAKLAREGWIR